MHAPRRYPGSFLVVFATLCAALPVVSACVLKTSCMGGSVKVDGECTCPVGTTEVPAGGGESICSVDDGGVSDGGDAGVRDGAIDEGTDAGTPDAGPCGMTCPAATPVCNDATGECVQCTSAAGAACTGATPLCDTTSNTCVACLTNSDCSMSGASECALATRTCVGCTADAACMRFAGTPVCDEGRATCVACTGDTEAARCGAFSCRRSDGACTTTMRASLDTCDACAADSECLSGRRCVEHVFMGTSTGRFCFLDASMGGCGDTDAARRPYSTRSMLTSVDGVAATYCMPPVATTCAGIRDTRSLACTTSDMCGIAGLADGYCPTGGPGAGACSYECGGAFDCASTLNCAGTPQHCRP